MKRPLCLSIALLFATAFQPSGAGLRQSRDEDSEIVRLRYATIIVRDYDEALRWYTDVLGLEKVEEGSFGPGQRWLVVAPRGQKEFGIVLAIAQPASPSDPVRAYADRVGKETKWVFEVQDCRKFFESRSKRGVKFLSSPADEVWGTYAMIEDLYGNVFVVQSPRQAPSGTKR